MNNKNLLILLLVIICNICYPQNNLDKYELLLKKNLSNYKYDEAIKNIDSLLIIRFKQADTINYNNPDINKYILEYSNCNKKLNTPLDAIVHLNNLYNCDTNNINVLNEIAECYLLGNKLIESANTYQLMINKDTSNRYFLNQKALVHIRADQWNDALKIYNRLYGLGDSTSNRINRLLGDCYYNLGKLPESVISYNNAIAINPLDYISVKKIATILLNNSQGELALSYTNSYCNLDSTNLDINRLNGISKYITEDFEGAIQRLDTLFIKYGDDSFNTVHYLECLTLSGE